MTDKLEKSLEEIIAEKSKKRKENKENKRGNAPGGRRQSGGNSNQGKGAASNRGGGRNAGGGNPRRGSTGTPRSGRGNNPLRRDDPVPAAYGPARGSRRSGAVLTVPYQPPVAEAKSAKIPKKSSGIPIEVSNLDPTMTIEEIQEIFKEIGGITGVLIRYDSNGQPSGEAQIQFQTIEQAEKAVKEFDKARIDDRPMRVSLGVRVVERIVPATYVPPPPISSARSQSRDRPRSVAVTRGGASTRGNRRGGSNVNNGSNNRSSSRSGSAGGRPARGKPAARGGGGRGGRGGRGGARGGRSGSKSEPKADKDSLDAELDAYKASAAPAASST